MDATITAVVPVLNEAPNLPALLGRLRQAQIEALVVDGGSRDDSVTLARSAGAEVISSRQGRARQMNLGAARAAGDILFFVHADSLPPPDAAGLIRQCLNRPHTAAGAFYLQIDSKRSGLRFITFMANVRTRFWKLPYGDQGLFLRKTVFEKIGGFPEWPLMEDVEMVRRLKKTGRVRLAPAAVITSARRWEKRGLWRQSWQNQVRLWRYYRGVPPEGLTSNYEDLR